MLDWIRRGNGPRPLSHIFIGLVIAAGLETALLAACAGSRNEPKKVAREFWTAMKEQDVAKARTCASRASAGSLQIQSAEGSKDFQFELGDAKKRGQGATVATIVMGKSDGKEFPIALETSLVKEDGAWKVDVNKTFNALFGAAFAAAAEAPSGTR